MTTYIGKDRRKVDPVQQQIEDLILAAESPKDKAFLLIMSKIALSLDANTTLTQKLSEDFDSHEKQAQAYLNQSKGGFRAALVLLGFIQLIGGFIISSTLSEIKSIRQDLIVVQRAVAIQEAGNNTKSK